MVVQRKQPAAPLQPISRSSSTQAVPTKRPQPLKNGPLNGGHDTEPKKTAPKSSKHKTKQRKRPKSYFDRIFLLSLSLFTLYTFYSCRPNPIFSKPNHNQSIDPNPLCRSLATYNNHVLQPYIIPTVKHGLAVTNKFAEPYVATAQVKLSPYVAPVVDAASTARPYVVRTAKVAKSVWTGTLVPFYKGTVKPYYLKAVLPRYRKYIQPRLAPLQAQASKYFAYYVSRPLHIQGTRLQNFIHAKNHQYIQPYLNQVQPYVVKTYHALHATFFQAVDAYNVHVHPQLSSAWIRVKPVLSVGWKHTKQFSIKAAEVGATWFRFVIREAGGYRRTYVDPHVIKIWEKVTEGTDGAPTETAITPPPSGTEVAATDNEPTQELVPEPTSVATAEPTTTPVLETAEPETESTLLANSAVPTPEEDAETVAPVDTKTASPPKVEETVIAPADTPVTSSVKEPAPTDAPAPEANHEPVVDAAVEPSEPATSTTVKPAASSSNEAKQAAQSATHSEEVEDNLDDFLKEIGIESVTATAGDAADVTSVTTDDQSVAANEIPQQPKLSEEEIAANVAKKRANIVGRHEKWFEQLEETVANESKGLMKTLEDWRAGKKTELDEMSGKAGAEKGLIVDVQKEGERLIKGLESYLRKAQGRSSTWKVASGAAKEEKEGKKPVATAEKDKWATVFSKVEGKFSERVVAMQSQVHSWFVSVKQRELDEVKAASLRVKDVADRAQADLGLDYAWLEDVTYEDWQGYHDLMRTYEDFESTAYALQNGTVLEPPIRPPPAEPIVPALDALHNDLQDVVLGFQVALVAVRSEAAKVFSLAESAEDDDDGFFVVRDGEVRRDDLRGVDLGGLGLTKEKEDVTGGVKTNEDEAKILPIDPAGGEEKKTEELDMNNIVIGKDKVQVEQVLGSVPLEPAASRHEEL